MRLTTAFLFMSFLSSAAMADTVPAAPPPAPTAPVALTAVEIQAIGIALNMAARQCETDNNGCAIGLQRASLTQKLLAAAKTLQK